MMSNPITPIHRELRRGTARLHQRLDEGLDILGPDLSPSRYRRILQALYGFYDPLEPRVRRIASELPPPGFPLASRSALLERDLRALGLSESAIAGLPRATELPPLSRVEHLAGCLYVLEGASLGGQVIARVLRKRLGLTENDGAAFFAGDREETAARFRRVLLFVDEVAQADTEHREIVASACDTFGALARFLEARGELRREVSQCHPRST